MIPAAQLAAVFSRRQVAQPSSALAEIVFLNEIRATLADTDPLHCKIVALFADHEPGVIDRWNQQYDQVLAEARRRIV